MSAKYEWAKKWNIPIVSETWVHDSISHGRLLMPKSFEPTLPDSNDIPLSLTDVSGPIPQYLNNCRVFISGISQSTTASEESNRFNILRRLVVMAGGLRLSSFEPAECTHWIVIRQSLSTESLEALKSAMRQAPNLFVVHDKWLVDCFKVGKRLEEGHYIFSIDPEEQPSAINSQSTTVPFRLPSQRRSLSQSSQPSAPPQESFTSERIFGSQMKRTLGTKLVSVLERLPDNKENIENADFSNKPLSGCTVAVSTRLWHRRAEVHSLVTELGGSFVYSLDRHCTHLIHSSTTRSDPLRDVSEAKSRSIKITSPEWLQECKRRNERVSEDLYPFYPRPPTAENTPAVDISQLNILSMATQKTNLDLSRTLPLLTDTLTTIVPQSASLLAMNSNPSMSHKLSESVLFSPVSQPISNLRYFCFTGLSESDKKRGSRLVTELGGLQAPLESPSWDPRVTHLISGRPSRSEKYLAAMASGAWILSLAYLEACSQAGSFEPVDEEQYEVGEEEQNTNVTNNNTQSTTDKVSISTAGRRWRMHLAPVKGKPATRGAFTGWRILLVCGEDKKRKDGFVRLLEAGGAVVFTVEDAVLPDPHSTTHLLLSSSSLRSRVKNDWLVHFDEKKIYTTEYIADYLMRPPV